MGVLYLANELVESNVMKVFLAFVMTSLGIAYFVYAHRAIFRKQRQSETTAVVVGIIGVGLGQAYNRQLKKSIIALVVFLLLIGIPVNGWIILLFYAATLIDAYVGAEKAERQLLYQMRLKEIKEKAEQICAYQEQGKEFANDTNILMHEPDLLVYLLENKIVRLHLSMMVFNELDGLKKSTNRTTRQNAQMAFDVIEAYQQKGRIQLLKTPKTEDIRQYGLGGSPDEKIIGTYLRESKQGQRNLMFLSN